MLGSSKLLHFRNAQSRGGQRTFVNSVFPHSLVLWSGFTPIYLEGEEAYDTPWSTLFERYCSAEIEILQPRSIWQALPHTSSVCSGFSTSPHGSDGIGKAGRDHGSRRGSKSG